MKSETFGSVVLYAGETTKAICECAGGREARDFNEIESAAKGGVAHGTGNVGRDSAMAKYGNETKRYALLTDADVDFVSSNADARLLSRLHYNASAQRRRDLHKRTPRCVPDRQVYLNSIGLKGSRWGPVPFDDELDTVVVNGFKYFGPKPSDRPKAQRLQRERQLRDAAAAASPNAARVPAHRPNRR